ncbi:hypothetical protein RMCBS344292_18860 [Rhizopus microsporus]|nr:hypothetical protein RMCBS344292_18860 [Rhizopus microsporus]
MTRLMSKPEIVSIHELNKYSLGSYSSFDSSSPTDSKKNNEEFETQIRQLTQQVEHLSIANARLKRANRMLKMESDKKVDEKTVELKQALKRLLEQNIRLQRSNRLLKDDSDTLREELRNIKQDHIRDMTQVGPEYEYLVQVVNILYRQLLTNKPQCAQTCCYTNKQITDKDKHACRPTVQSNLSRGKIQLENEKLKDKLDSLMQENELLTELIKEKERDNKELKEELKIKDDIVQQLEYDFKQMESEVNDLQKDICYNHPSAESSLSEILSFPSVPI